MVRVNDLRHTAVRDKARKLLGWVACAPTPMTVREIQQAVSIRPGGQVATFVVDAQIEKICGPIVEVVDDCVQFVHFTVKE